jgi:hypothetical protein
LEVELDNVVFVGSDLHLLGRLADGTRIVALHRHARGGPGSALAAGAKVSLSYAPEAPHVMEAGAP